MNLRLTRGEIPDHLLKYFKPIGHKQKDLINTPYYMAEALREDGWYLRSDIAWIKAAPMPESVRDRPTSAWEHIWMLTKGPKYFWDAEAVRQPNADSTLADLRTNEDGHRRDRGFPGSPSNGGTRLGGESGANMRNFWLLGPDPYSGSHFATFVRELVRRCVAATTSEYGCCGKCGAAWKRVVERGELVAASERGRHGYTLAKTDASGDVRASNWARDGVKPGMVRESTTTGWQPTCRCGPGAGVRPCVVADPFSGSGTTAFVAASMGRVGIGVELSAEYTEQARYGRLAQEFLPLAPEAPQAPATPARPAERPVGMFDGLEVGA